MSTTASGARISAAGRFDHSNRIPSRFRTRCRHPPAPLARPATRTMASGVVPRPPPSGAPPRIPRTRRTRGGLAAFASGACTAVRRVSSSAGSLSTSRASPSALPTKRIPAATSSGLSASGPRRTVTRRSRGCRRFGVALHPPRRSRGRARVPARPPVRGGGSSRCSPPRRSRAVCAGLIDPDRPLVRASDHGARARNGDQGEGADDRCRADGRDTRSGRRPFPDEGRARPSQGVAQEMVLDDGTGAVAAGGLVAADPCAARAGDRGIYRFVEPGDGLRAVSRSAADPRGGRATGRLGRSHQLTYPTKLLNICCRAMDDALRAQPRERAVMPDAVPRRLPGQPRRCSVGTVRPGRRATNKRART